MSLSRTRLDRIISKKCAINRKKVRLLIAQKRIMVDGIIASGIDQQVNKFSIIYVNNQLVQQVEPLYIMLHKPVGVVCATKDDKHKTVIDILGSYLSAEQKASLHIVGRLDLNTSGLVLLTNDSRWSELLTSPISKVPKHYKVTLQRPLSKDYIEAFSQGMYFGYEDITTKPVELKIISEFNAEVILTEGRYHQIKRMFGRFNNPVVALHRTSIGDYVLDKDLKVGESKLIKVNNYLFQ